MFIRLGIIFGVLTLAAHVAADQDIQPTKEKEVKEYFTGRSITNQEATAKADLIFLGELEDRGVLSPDAPGQSYHEHAAVRVQRIIRASDVLKKGESGVGAGQILKISFTVQTMPADVAESEPPLHIPLIFIAQARKITQAGKSIDCVAIKILRSNESSLKEISELAGSK